MAKNLPWICHVLCPRGSLTLEFVHASRKFDICFHNEGIYCWDIHCQVQCNNSVQQRLVFNFRSRASTTASFGSNDIVLFISNIGGLNGVIQLNILEGLLAVALRRERQLELVRISSSFPGIHSVISGLVN